MKRKVVDVKNPSLREISKAVGKIDKKIMALVGDLKDTLEAQKDPEGVGLAAPQIGKNVRIFLINYKSEERVVINPEIIKISGVPKVGKEGKSEARTLEGCLSLPHYYGPIKRAGKIRLKYQTVEMANGQWLMVKKMENFSGFIAHVVQHEIDHLNGILFVDHILEQKAPLYKFAGDEWEEVELA